MKRSSDIDFSVPQRQSYIAVLLILLKRGKVILQQLLPVLVVIWLGGERGGLYFVIAIILVTILTFIYAIVNFFRTKFYITGDEIVLNTGVFNHKKLSIKLDKVQTVNFEQTIIHRIFDVYRVKVDTAGSSKDEFVFQALDINKAKAIQALIIQKRGSAKTANVPRPLINTEYNQDETKLNANLEVSILKLSPTQLLKVGLTENHIRSFGLIIAFFLYWYHNLKEVGIDVDEYSQELDYQSFVENFIYVSFIFIIIIAILISVIRSVIKYYDLRFFRTNGGFKIISGLFTKREVAAQDTKIQYITWAQNLLQSFVNFFELTLSQASSAKVSRKQTIAIPGLTAANMSVVINSLFGPLSFGELDKKHRVDRAYFSRFTQIFITILIIAAAVGVYFQLLTQLFIISLIIFWLIFVRYLKYQNLGYSYDSERLKIFGGAFGKKYSLLPIYKIQSIALNTTPYQQRLSLCSLTIHTASGALYLPYISQKMGRNILDTFIDKVETDHRKWM